MQSRTAENGEMVDEADVWFGFRTLSWSTRGFFVNGKKTLLRGACVHHDNGILGACSFEDAEFRRVRLLKEAGFNAIRSAHNPASKALLDACDRLGLYVMDEFCDNWLVHKNPYDYADQDFRAWWQQDLTAMVIKNYNHPSVVMNSIGNEISELAIPEGQEYCKKLAVLARKLDPDKAVTMGVNLMLCSMSAKGGGIYGNKKNGKENQNGSQTMDNVPTSAFFNMLMNLAGGMIEKMAAKPAADDATKVSFSYLDIGGYNYAASRYEKDGTLHPDRVIVGSETLPKNLYHNWQLVKNSPMSSATLCGRAGIIWGRRASAPSVIKVSKSRSGRAHHLRRQRRDRHLRKASPRGTVEPADLGAGPYPRHRRRTVYPRRRDRLCIHVA